MCARRWLARAAAGGARASRFLGPGVVRSRGHAPARAVSRPDISLSAQPDRHIRDTSWRLSRADGSTVISGGQYNFLAFNTTRSQSACMPDGRYNFAIFDEEGDGLCCEHGHGQFRVLVAGAEVARGATFRSQATVPVLVGASVSAGALESFNANVSLLSSAVSIEVTLDNRPEDNEWEVLDDNGVIVMAGWRSKEQLLFPGRYHFRMYDSRADGMCCAHCDHNACGYKLSVDAQLVATGGSFAGRPYDERGFVIAELLNPECYKHDDAFDCARVRVRQPGVLLPGPLASSPRACAHAHDSPDLRAAVRRPRYGEQHSHRTAVPTVDRPDSARTRLRARRVSRRWARRAQLLSQPGARRADRVVHASESLARARALRRGGAASQLSPLAAAQGAARSRGSRPERQRRGHAPTLPRHRFAGHRPPQNAGASPDGPRRAP